MFLTKLGNKIPPRNITLGLAKKFKIDNETYLKEVDRFMEEIFEQIDEKELPIADNISLASGVLNMTFSGNKNYVINIQRPNQQIWLSSPFSGPQRFEFDQQQRKWLNVRNHKDLVAILNDEINQMLQDNKVDLTIDLH